ncbi:MAG: hypothetical protein KatS3mg062_1091 [Tepidiforma sp.]|nr:MAG: hypothetical protein KatS3mg062_1091 [Tepidiforma sp.]
MSDADREYQRLLDEARRARDEAERLRREAHAEAQRLKAEARRAREEARRQREAARNARQRTAATGDPADAPARAERPFPPLEGIRALEIDNTAGKLTVRACSGDELPIIAAAASKNAPEIQVDRAGDTLRIHIRVARGWLFRRKQSATSLVRLPPHHLRSLRIANGYGEIEAAALEAESIRISTGAGAITAVGLRGDLEVSVGAGKVTVLAHEGTASAHSGTGDITLDLAAVPPGMYRVDVGLGRAEVRIPPGTQVEVRANSGLGKTNLGVPSVPGAPAVIKVNSGVGEASVRIREPGAAPPPPRPSRPAPPARAAERRREAEELRVLQLLEQGRITPQDAADLIAALRGMPPPPLDDSPEED